MLRDVIAAIVVNRAIELACLASPGEAFTTTREQWRPVAHSRTITTPNPKLTGFEIVLASSNNGAVENVSTEIPGPKGIDGQWREAAAAVNYFSQIAGHDAWALVAARLGNRANRAAFARDFWFDSDSSIRNVLQQPAALPLDWQGAEASFRRALLRASSGSVSSGRRAAHRCSRWLTGSPSMARRYPARLATSRFGSARRCECTCDVTGPCSASATRSPMTA